MCKIHARGDDVGTQSGDRAGDEACVMSEWFKIESSPRDGTPVDLWSNDVRWTDCSWNRLSRPLLKNGINKTRNKWVYLDNEGCYDEVWGIPTHWMPIPMSPQSPSQFRAYVEQFGCTIITDDKPVDE